ncbi:MAG: SPOR domain-containing protein [Acidobacteria bacterium]|nr:SPOR domain-containing protein [Acidobacteriota bacterium]MBI3428135.1 SPOR domain-containing protein [Acidobacteriota bacterium]
MKNRPTFSLSFLTICLVLVLAATALAQAGRFALQFGAYPTRSEAEEKMAQLKAAGLDVYLVKSNVAGKGVFYRVRTGNFASRAAAEQKGQQLKAQGAFSEYYVANYEKPDAEAPANVASNTPKTTAAPPMIKPAPTAPAPVNTAPPTAKSKEQPNTASTATLTPNSTTTSKPTANTTPVSASSTMPPATAAANPPATATSNPAGNPANAGAGYSRYQDQAAGYSFEIPQYWVGGSLNSNEMQSQKVSAGAMFKSNEDAAFLNAIWNKLDKANSPDHDNDMIVDLILKSMGSGNGIQNMQALSRRVVTEGQQIKTFLDLKAAFQVPNQPAPLDFIGKGVIIRANKGILLLVTFFSKDAPQTVALTADHIIQTARTPE